jgi:hypothetical protein
MQQYRIEHFSELNNDRFPGFPSAKEEAIAIGEITPEDVRKQFAMFRQMGIDNTAQKIAEAYSKGDGSNVDWYTRWLVASQNLSLEDVHTYGTWELILIQYRLQGHSPDDYNEKFPEVVDLIQEAIKTEAKALPNSPSLSDPDAPPHTITTSSNK